MELYGIAEHHEYGKAKTCNRHGDTVWVAVKDVGADVLTKSKVTRDPNSKISANGNAVSSADNIIQTSTSFFGTKFVEYSE